MRMTYWLYHGGEVLMTVNAAEGLSDSEVRREAREQNRHRLQPVDEERIFCAEVRRVMEAKL